MNSIDVFSETNPAFCSLVLLSFCEGYELAAETTVPFPLLILPIPIILSGDLLKTFDGTNVKTGFFSWIKNNPVILIKMTERIEDSQDFIKPAIEFAVSKSVIGFTPYGEVKTHRENVLNYSNANGASQYFKLANRLGHWLGEIKSVKTIYNHLGIHV
ncbi:hypothetical protein DCC81_14535 [Chitinophaga parva]|uniref:Uncharacterized protein n=1 Tax=Chitinophaga parva TaxID=2169414 RepID=A0A2T7BGT8_9BACT|nr:three component ABC system middle component [Chitinophaga parva]PUZ25498.1 hypothetical protein DCC81_14535 [Chitinophaga parva]